MLTILLCMPYVPYSLIVELDVYWKAVLVLLLLHSFEFVQYAVFCHNVTPFMLQFAHPGYVGQFAGLVVC